MKNFIFFILLTTLLLSSCGLISHSISTNGEKVRIYGIVEHPQNPFSWRYYTETVQNTPVIIEFYDISKKGYIGDTVTIIRKDLTHIIIKKPPQ